VPQERPWQTQTLLTQDALPWQKPLQVPPQPSDAPQALPVQDGVQVHWPPTQSSPWGQHAVPQVTNAQAQAPLTQVFPAGQAPVVQVPPQPSAAPQGMRGPQSGTQGWVHWPPSQTSPGPQQAVPQVAKRQWQRKSPPQASFMPQDPHARKPPQPSVGVPHSAALEAQVAGVQQVPPAQA